MKRIATFAFLVIAFFILWMLFHLGAFKPVTISVSERGPLLLLYKVHRGAYHKIVPVIEEVETWAQAHGEKCVESFGEYLDDPDTIEEDRLTSNGGCLLERPATDIPKDFKMETRHKQNYVIAEFEGAPSIGPIKVYPKVEKYFVEKRLVRDGKRVMEIYQRLQENGIRTTYHFPIAPGQASGK